MRAKPTDRLKTPEEIAMLEKNKLEQLEVIKLQINQPINYAIDIHISFYLIPFCLFPQRERIRRMKGEAEEGNGQSQDQLSGSTDKKPKARSGNCEFCRSF